MSQPPNGSPYPGNNPSGGFPPGGYGAPSNPSGGMPSYGQGNPSGGYPGAQGAGAPGAPGGPGGPGGYGVPNGGMPGGGMPVGGPQYGGGPGGPGGPQQFGAYGGGMGPGGPGGPGGMGPGGPGGFDNNYNSGGGSSKGPMIAIVSIIAVLVVAIIGGGIYLFTRDSGDDNETAQGTSSTVVTSQNSRGDAPALGNTATVPSNDPEPTSEETDTPSEETTESSSGSDVSGGNTLEMTATANGTISVYYSSPEETFEMEDEVGTSWSKTYDISDGSRTDYFYLSPSPSDVLDDSIEYSCEIKIDGQVVDSDSGQGFMDTVSCSWMP